MQWSKLVPSKPGLYLMASESLDIELVKIRVSTREGFMLILPDFDHESRSPMEAIANSDCSHTVMFAPVFSPYES